LEEQNIHLNREIGNLKSELEEQERDADEILKKYQLNIHNYSLDSHRFTDLNNQIDILSVENRMLKEKIREMEEKCSFYESSWIDRTESKKMENKLRELENKLEFESTHRIRLQNHLDRVKQQYENSQNEIELILGREKKCEENLRKVQRHSKEILEEFGDLKKKLIDYEETKKRIEQQNEILERELDSCRSEIKINQTRLEAFQNAFNAMNESDDEDDEQNDDESDLAEDFSDITDSDRASSSKFLNVSMSKMSVKSGDLN
ncbi:unconventional myosin-XVIIIa, partial [Brachionus plicatilis]